MVLGGLSAIDLLSSSNVNQYSERRGLGNAIDRSSEEPACQLWGKLFANPRLDGSLVSVLCFGISIIMIIMNRTLYYNYCSIKCVIL